MTASCQNEHSNCNEVSSCKCPGYSPTKIKLENPLAIESYTSAVRNTLIYKNAESYCPSEVFVFAFSF